MVTTKMSITSRKDCRARLRPRYLKADKKTKSLMLKEFCRSTGYNEKYAVRILSPSHEYKLKVISRKGHCIYANEDIFWLKKVWEIMDYSCGQRPAPQLEEIISKLVFFKELDIPKTTQEKLKYISSATIDNGLKRFKNELRLKINSTTRPGGLLKSQIPIRTVSWNETRIGYCEMDTVTHCGDSAAGEFISSLDLTDILTQWTETETIMGRAQSRVIAGLENIKNRLPFSLLAIDPDNGKRVH